MKKSIILLIVLLQPAIVLAGNATVVGSFNSPDNYPRGMAYHNFQLWNIDKYYRKLYSVDPGTGTATEFCGLRAYGPWGVWKDDLHIWVASEQENNIQKYSITDCWNTVAVYNTGATLNQAHYALTKYDGYFWLTHGNYLSKLTLDDTGGYTVIGTWDKPTNIPNVPAGFAGFEIVGGSLFAVQYNYNLVKPSFLIEFPLPQVGQPLAYQDVSELQISNPTGITHDGTYFWISDTVDKKIYKVQLDRATRTPTMTPTFTPSPTQGTPATSTPTPTMSQPTSTPTTSPTPLPTATPVQSCAPCIHTETVSVGRGWSMLGFLRAPQGVTTAQELIEALVTSNIDATHLAGWSGGGWSVYQYPLPFNNFAIESNRGYMVRCSQGGSWTFQVDMCE